MIFCVVYITFYDICVECITLYDMCVVYSTLHSMICVRYGSALHDMCGLTEELLCHLCLILCFVI